VCVWERWGQAVGAVWRAGKVLHGAGAGPASAAAQTLAPGSCTPTPAPQVAINENRNKYRTVACRGASLFFLLNSLNKVHAFYQFSLNAFVGVFCRGIDLAPGGVGKKRQLDLGKVGWLAGRVMGGQLAAAGFDGQLLAVCSGLCQAPTCPLAPAAPACHLPPTHQQPTSRPHPPATRRRRWLAA
jgi:hypothetical protein